MHTEAEEDEARAAEAAEETENQRKYNEWWNSLIDAQAVAIVAAHNASMAASVDPWRPGAHEEERVAVGGERQFCAQDQRPPDSHIPPGRVCASGGAGRWLAVGMVPDTDYSGDHPATYMTTVWARWLVPVQP